MACPIASKAPKIDGSLDDPAWAKAAIVSPLALSDGTGMPGTKTECRVMRDTQNLFVAFKCDQGSGESAPGVSDSFVAEDCVAVEFKPDPTQKWFYRAAVDASGKRESVCCIDKPFSILTLALQRPKVRRWEWDGDWRAAVKTSEGSWTTEMAIPFAAVSRSMDLDEWALNLFRVSGGTETSWSPTYRGSWKSGHWSSTFRASAERYRFGVLRGLADIPAQQPSKGLYTISEVAFQHQPDGTLSLLAEVRGPAQVPWQGRRGEIKAEVKGPNQDAVQANGSLNLTSGRQTVKIAGLGLKALCGAYQVTVRLTDSDNGQTLHSLDSWQSVVYGHTCDEGAGPPGLLFDRTYFPRLYELRAQTEFSYYTNEREARLLAESGLDEMLRLRVEASPRHKPDETRLLAESQLAKRSRSMLSLDIAGLSPGEYDLKLIAADAQGKTRAAALAELIKLPPKVTGSRTNRFTGCLWVNGKPRIIHAAHMPFSDRVVDWIESHNFNALMMGLKVPEQGKDAATARLIYDRARERGIGTEARI